MSRSDADRCGYEKDDGHPCELPACRADGRCWHHTEAEERTNGGRDPKLTLERQEQICGAIENGKSVKSAARMAGIHPATVYSWLDKGEDQDEGIYADFRDRFVRARGHGEDLYVQSALDLALEEGDIATLMSMLKQRYPDSWGDVDRGEQSGAPGISLYNEAPGDIDALIDERKPE